jgi:hypothetical protein
MVEKHNQSFKEIEAKGYTRKFTHLFSETIDWLVAIEHGFFFFIG